MCQIKVVVNMPPISSPYFLFDIFQLLSDSCPFGNCVTVTCNAFRRDTLISFFGEGTRLSRRRTLTQRFGLPGIVLSLTHVPPIIGDCVGR